MEMNIYGLTRSKQLINYLNKSNVCISYKDITVQNKRWEKMVKNGESGTTILKKGVPTHSSIDNIDEETESLSLHFTNSNVYQPNAGGSNEGDQTVSIERFHPGTTEEIPSYYIGKLSVGPKLFPGYIDDTSDSLLQKRLSMDIIWSIICGIPNDIENEELPMIGSWTNPYPPLL